MAAILLAFPASRPRALPPGAVFTVQQQWPSGWHTDQETAVGFLDHDDALGRAALLRVRHGLPTRVRIGWSRLEA